MPTPTSIPSERSLQSTNVYTDKSKEHRMDHSDKDTSNESPKKESESPNRPALKPCATVAQLNRAYLRAIVQAWEEQNLILIEALGLPISLARQLATSP